MGAHAGDSSPSSAESSFRQIDDVFLQTQTRIWLGEVLQTRLSDQISIADLLADGELLFEVSREVWKMMLERHMDLKYKYEYEPFASRNSGRYMPYSNVDSFLKICKILGLTGIDLFSPSDVVEKRDTRKVCMCIRALSKKARSRHLSVPDFDIVTYTAAMPTDMVGYIRRSWELSHCDNSSSSSLSPNHELRERYRQKHLNAISGRSYDYNEESDETERKVSLQSDSSATICPYSPTSQISCDSINSPEVSSVVQSILFDQHSEQLDVQNQIQDECIQFEQRSVCSDKLTGFRLSNHLQYDQEPDNLPSLSSLDSNITLGSLDSNAESGARTSHKNNVEDRIYVDPSLEDRASVLGDSVECSTAESNITYDCPIMSAISNHESCTGDFVPLDGKDGIFDACVGFGSFCSEETTTPQNILRSQYIDVDDVEVSSIASVTSLSISLRNLDFVDQAENAFKNVWFPDSANSNSGALDEKCQEGSKSQGVVKYDMPGQRLTSNNKGVVFDTRHSNNNTAGYLDHAISYDNSLHISQINSNSLDEGKRFVFSQWDQKGKCQIAVVPNSGGRGTSSVSLSPVDSNEENHQPFQIVKGGTLRLENLKPIKADNYTKVCSTTTIKSIPDIGKQPNPSLSSSCCDDVINRRHEISNNSCNVAAESENVNEDKERNEKLQMSTVDSDGIGNPTIPIAERKPQKRPLLKAVVKGTAAIGAMFLLLHFRFVRSNVTEVVFGIAVGCLQENWQREINGVKKATNKKRNVNGEDFFLAEGQRSQRADGVYPAEKLKLGI